MAKKAKKQTAELAPWQAVEVDDDRSLDQPRCPPSIPPLRIESKPGMVNVAAVASEPWLRDISQKPLHAAYCAGRLWNAVSWLQDFAALFHHRLKESVLLEIGRLEPYFLRACEYMRSHASPTLAWARLHDSWLSWLRSERFDHHLESVWLDHDTGESKIELDADDIAPPNEVKCLQTLGIEDTAENANLITAMKLGITVDRALRCWHTRDGKPSPRFRDPWIDESAHCADAAWSESIQVQAQVLGILEKSTVSDTPCYADVEAISNCICRGLGSIEGNLDTIDSDRLGMVREIIEEKPNATQKTILQEMRKKFGTGIGHSTLTRILDRLRDQGLYQVPARSRKRRDGDSS